MVYIQQNFASMDWFQKDVRCTDRGWCYSGNTASILELGRRCGVLKQDTVESSVTKSISINWCRKRTKFSILCIPNQLHQRSLHSEEVGVVKENNGFIKVEQFAIYQIQ